MFMAIGLLILRLGIGLIIAAHGAQKLFGVWGGPGMEKWTQSVQRLRIRPAQPWAWVAASMCDPPTGAPRHGAPGGATSPG